MQPTNGSNGRPTEAVDRDPQSRPGVPRMKERGATGEGTTRPGPTLARQGVDQVPVLVSVDVGQLTPVFSTAVPPRGLSGLMRRAAYRIPEHRTKRWAMLLLADRVDVWESRVRRHPVVAATLVASAAGLVIAGGQRR
jgi:hypothetical protein